MRAPGPPGYVGPQTPKNNKKTKQTHKQQQKSVRRQRGLDQAHHAPKEPSRRLHGSARGFSTQPGPDDPGAVHAASESEHTADRAISAKSARDRESELPGSRESSAPRACPH